MKVMGDRLVDDEEYEAYVLLATKALLGNGKAKAIMKRLRIEDEAAHELAMLEAWRKHASLPPEARSDHATGLRQLAVESLRVQFRMIRKARDAGALYPNPGSQRIGADSPRPK